MFTTELIVSELVTNAIRYGGAPVGLRLIRDQRLICEVSDPSQAQPHLRRARWTDEGGRGLVLVAQLTHRWGSRYTVSGKSIWTEPLGRSSQTCRPGCLKWCGRFSRRSPGHVAPWDRLATRSE
ncbi:ATP-binding protein [Streptomyces tibetensis]|uniref:ATP-binding protein n=1 Tax=Streptomyces tibetensis TaxID=2382123 RepID=UPI003F4D6FE6